MSIISPSRVLLLVLLVVSMPPVAKCKTVPIPKTIDLGSYSVTLIVPDYWKAAVNHQAGFVRYTLNESPEFGAGAVELDVFRFRLKEELLAPDSVQLAKALVVDDGLKFQETIYGKRQAVRLVVDRDVKLTSPAGEVHCFRFDRPLAGPVGRLFTSVALIIPPDVSSRRIVYLVIGYETRYSENPRHLDLVEKIVSGLREARPQPNLPAKTPG